MVNTVYASDADVQNDRDLQEFGQFVRGSLPRFTTKFQSREEVARFASTLWWVCTGYHAISFSVADYEVYPPFRPTLMTRPLPLLEKNPVLTEEDVTLSLAYPKKNMLIRILIGGVTNKDCTPNMVS